LKRQLFAANALGMDNYIESRERTKLQVTNIDTFKQKMQEFVKDDNLKQLVFTEDLKNMVHIAQKDDSELLVQMIKRFCSQSKEVRFGNFIFGPPVMRYYHYIRDADSALAIFKDESLDGFFDQLITYQILLDLLYKTGKFQEILDTYDVIQSRQLQGSRNPKHVIILVFAACYKINTKESLEYAKKMWHQAVEAGHLPLRRGATFLSALAVKLNQPFVALEVLATLKGQNYVSVRALKAIALAEMKRFDDVIPLLRTVLDRANPLTGKQTIPRDLLEQLQELFKANDNKDLQADFEKVIGFITTHGHLSDETLDQVLCSEIQLIVRDQSNMGPPVRRVRNLNQIELDRPSRTYQRPGLHELN
jgi:pentatricopeptide repeat domain-containing protein 2